jgi:hypothetical protein
MGKERWQMTQYLYLIKCQQYYKIGVANDVQSRLAQLSTGNPFELEPLTVSGFDNASAVETVLHQRFAAKRQRGEWFSLNSDDVATIDKIIILLGGTSAPDITEVDECEIEQAEETQETQDILVGGVSWRLERRNDRNPPGYAIYQRGRKVYLGYVGMRSLSDPDHPTVEEIEAVIARHKRVEEMEPLFEVKE